MATATIEHVNITTSDAPLMDTCSSGCADGINVGRGLPSEALTNWVGPAQVAPSSGIIPAPWHYRMQ